MERRDESVSSAKGELDFRRTERRTTRSRNPYSAFHLPSQPDIVGLDSLATPHNRNRQRAYLALTTSLVGVTACPGTLRAPLAAEDRWSELVGPRLSLSREREELEASAY